jgi:hypothetical protein
VIIGAGLLYVEASTEDTSSAGLDGHPFYLLAKTWGLLAHPESKLLLLTQTRFSGVSERMVLELAKYNGAQDSGAEVIDVIRATAQDGDVKVRRSLPPRALRMYVCCHAVMTMYAMPSVVGIYIVWQQPRIHE